MRQAALLFIAFSCLCMQSVLATDKPNIVILFADDLGYGDLGSYGHPYIRTPNIDQLAAEGQRWTDFYVADPVCSPSRGALLTGRLPVRTGLYGKQVGVLFPNDTVGMPASERTLAEALKSEGYATAIIGKWHLGDAPAFYPTRHGFDYWYGVPYSNDMDWAGMPTFEEFVKLRASGDMDAMQQAAEERMRRYHDPKIEYWNVPVIRSERRGTQYVDTVVERPAQQTQITQRQTEEALKFIDANQSNPFLLYVPYSMVHTPLFRSKAFVGRSLGGLYGDVVEELDWSVGAIVDKLRELDLGDNTLVIFTSDNGPWLFMDHHGGSAGLLNNGKATTFEGGMRVPAVFWWPGHIEPGVVSDIGSTLDLFTTITTLANASGNSSPDGHDLSGTLLDGTPSPRDSIAYYRSGELRAYRKGDFKLQLVTEGAYGMPPMRTDHDDAPLLHRLSEDPSERFNVAEKYPEVVKAITNDIKKHRAQVEVKPPLFDERLKRMFDDNE